MDYQTKPTSRVALRELATYVRLLFDVSPQGSFPVLQVLERLPDVIPNSGYSIVEDHIFPRHVMARCFQNSDGGFTIEIKESVYDGAYRNIGAYLGFICHEICHIILFVLGFTPIVNRSFQDNEIPAYCSVEWQAKCLCSEVMIPYTDSIGMHPDRIVEIYHVSKAFAWHRWKLDRR